MGLSARGKQKPTGGCRQECRLEEQHRAAAALVATLIAACPRCPTARGRPNAITISLIAGLSVAS